MPHLPDGLPAGASVRRPQADRAAQARRRPRELSAPLPLDHASFDAARRLHRRAGLIDLHVDSLIATRLFGYDVRTRHHPGVYGQPLLGHADIPRMMEADYGGACMGVHYWPVESERAWREANKQMDALDRVTREDPRVWRVHEPADWDRARGAGKLALAIGVEGAHMLAGRVERVAHLAERGVAYLTLAHFGRNAAATPSMGRGANEQGRLTDFGRDLVHACHRAGVVVDIAHLNTPCAEDVCAAARAPIFCTHTGLKGVCDVARNISDDVLAGVARLNGAVGIIVGPVFLKGSLTADTEAFVDHVDYVVARVGPEHVCFGSDYDGWLPTILSDHRDVRDTLRITDALLRRGYAEEAILGFWRGNALRVFREAWRARG